MLLITSILLKYFVWSCMQSIFVREASLLKGLFYILTSAWVLRTLNIGQNVTFQFFAQKSRKSKKLSQNLPKMGEALMGFLSFQPDTGQGFYSHNFKSFLLD